MAECCARKRVPHDCTRGGAHLGVATRSDVVTWQVLFSTLSCFSPHGTPPDPPWTPTWAKLARGSHLIAAQTFDDEQVVEFVALLFEVDALHPGGAPPPSEGLVEVEQRDVREVGHACDRLEEPEALDRSAFEEAVELAAQEEVRCLDEPRSRDRRSRVRARPDGGIVEGERLQALCVALSSSCTAVRSLPSNAPTRLGSSRRKLFDASVHALGGGADSSRW